MTSLLLIATLASIGALTALAALARRTVWARLCPLCAGVSGTWIGLLALHWAGAAVDLRLPALLMGGSVVGLTALGERALGERPPGTVLAWKSGVVVVGMGTAFLLLEAAWAAFALGTLLFAALLAVPWLLMPRAGAAAPTEGQATVLAQLKNCC